MDSTAAAALDYLARGWAVVPVHVARSGRCSCGRPDCPSPGKHPRVRWERYQHDRPADGTVRRWWARWPDSNLSVVTGAVSDLLVLDVDPRHSGDATLADLEARWGARPQTVESRTGGGGLHCWFRSPADPPPSGPVAPGLDVKCEGGLVVAPPSRHASGRRYAWRAGAGPSDRPLVAPPAWLVDLARGVPGPEPHHPLAAPGPRTSSEQEEFAAAWERAGVLLAPGDRYYLCPFHDDHHPSLHVDTEGCRWFCFGCHRGGGPGALRRELGEPGRGEPTVPRHRHVVAADPAAAITLTGTVPVDVVGESEHQDVLLAICGGRRPYGGVEVHTVARLGPDAEQPLDLLGVAVLIENRVVGRLRREDAARYRPRVEEAIRAEGQATCAAVIRGGWDRGRGDVGYFGVTLFLP